MDIWAAEIVCERKDILHDVRLICAVPYENQANGWNENYRERYDALLSKADKVMLMSRHYTRTCLRERNEWMVNQSGYIIAVCGNGKSGSASTLAYAKRKGLRTVRIDPVGLSVFGRTI